MAKHKQQNKNLENMLKGQKMIENHPMFSPLWSHISISMDENHFSSDEGYATVTKSGYIYLNQRKKAKPEQWMYIIAHCLLHLGFEHFKEKKNQAYWNIACDVFIARFLHEMKLGNSPFPQQRLADLQFKDEETLYNQFMDHGLLPQFLGFGTAGDQQADMLFQQHFFRYGDDINWGELLGQGLANAVAGAVAVASGHAASLESSQTKMSNAIQAKNWFIDSYPLLGSLAADFTIIEDMRICSRLDISIAAIDVVHKEIYINPAAGLSKEECKFVMAHELLHAGLCHHERRQGRDHYYWNISCDFVINQWLIEMGVGEFPKVGGLIDPELKGLSAESIYDRIVTDMRTYRKLYTLRGIGGSDIIDQANSAFKDLRDGVSLEDFYKSCLSQGLTYHQQTNQGYLPLGLVEEIKALDHPPIRWDVELAKWFDHYFQPIEKRRTYARLSRRQSSTPSIPRPKWVDIGGSETGRTFGVVLDTSGSMDKKLLAKALGAIASYSLAREVPAVRVIYCDAIAYDAGFISPDMIAEGIKVKGRGGTLLQPGVNLLENAADFPKDGPVLVITDGYCDRITIKREHAYLMPKGNHLPFIPRGEVFRID